MKRIRTLEEEGLGGSHLGMASSAQLQPYIDSGAAQRMFVLQEMEYQLSLPGRKLSHAQRLQWLKSKGLLGSLAAKVWDVIGHPRETLKGPAAKKAAMDHLHHNHGMKALEIDLGVDAAVRHGNLRHLGVNPESFIADMAPVFDDLPYDQYDLKRMWLEALKDNAPEIFTERVEDLRTYYVNPDETFPSDLLIHIRAEDRERLESLQPWRKRGIARFQMSDISTPDQEKTEIVNLPVEAFEQPEGDDIRAWPRTFQTLSDQVLDNDSFQQLLARAFEYIREVDHTVERVEATVHFMGVQARANQAGDNAPEGPHQDGADYIFSAIVVERENIKGGESVIYLKGPDGKLHELYRDTLEQTEWLCQADVSSGENFGPGNTLYHTVTPFTLEDPDKPGYRNIIGLDIKVLGRQ